MNFIVYYVKKSYVVIDALDEIAGVRRCRGRFPLDDAPPAARALDHW